MLDFKWNPGLAVSQKRKNVLALHEAARGRDLAPVLEVSTKSDDPLGRELSAFNLIYRSERGWSAPLECAFQSAKTFERSGPHVELRGVEPREARRSHAGRDTGRLTRFELDGVKWKLDPPTAFYDWLYIQALRRSSIDLRMLTTYRAFSDIEFNPAKSINCQARSCALYMALSGQRLLGEALESPSAFIAIVEASRMGTRAADRVGQDDLPFEDG